MLYTVLPFDDVFAKPFFCSLADRYNAHRLLLLLAISAAALGYGSLALLPLLNGHRLAWYVFCAGVMVANSAMGVTTSLTDAISMKEVTSESSTTSYGSIRLFGTIGWGVFGLIAGAINDEQLFHKLSITLPYLSPGVFMFIFVIGIDIIIIGKFLKKSGLELEPMSSNLEMLTNTTDKKRSSVWRDVINLSREYPSLILNCIVITIIGALTS